MKYTYTIYAMVAISCHGMAADPSPREEIKAYCIDFNWGAGGPNGFARPGLWADADPDEHVKHSRAKIN